MFEKSNKSFEIRIASPKGLQWSFRNMVSPNRPHLPTVFNPNSASCKKTMDIFGNYTRYMILLISLLCLTSIISNSLTLNFAIICMNKEENYTVSIPDTPNNFSLANVNSTIEVVETRIVPFFSLAEQSLLFSAIAIGSLLGTLPITYLTSSFGLRIMLTSYGIISGLSTLLIPLSITVGFIPTVILRVLQGCGVATTYVAMGAISSSWSPLFSMGMFISLLSCHFQFSPMFTMPVSGMLCESRWGWPGIFYVHGLLSFFLFMAFFYFYRDVPKFQRHVSHAELMKIDKGKIDKSNMTKKEKAVPYKAMLTDKCVWGILSSGFGAMLGFNLCLQYGPVLNMNVQKTGLSAALPFAIAALFKFLAGPISDRIKFLTEYTKIIMFASMSQFVMAACFLFMGMLPKGYPLLSQIGFTTAIVFSGLNCVGVVKDTQLIAQHFSHVIMAWNTLLSGLGVLLLPVLVSLIAPNNTASEWGRLFIGTAILIILVTMLFNWTAEVNPREWTHSNSVKSSVNDVNEKKNVFTVDSF